MFVKNLAPYFKAAAVMPDNTINESFIFEEYINSHMAVVFFYPLDFTFVCPTEIVEFNDRLGEFEARGVKVIGISVDSVYSHLAWKKTVVTDGGIGNIQYPLVSDLDKSIARSYGVLLNGELALRGTFIIDKNMIVRHMSVNDLPIGRSVDEVLRLVDAIKFADENGEVCPANWRKGSSGMSATIDGVKEYFSRG
jgi:peroxiredoxin 2/4